MATRGMTVTPESNQYLTTVYPESVSHDRFFLDRICHRILEIDNGIVTDYPGGYSYYQQNRDKGTTLTRGLNPPVSAKAKRAKAAAR